MEPRTGERFTREQYNKVCKGVERDMLNGVAPSVTQHEKDELYRIATEDHRRENPNRVSDYYDGEFGPIESLPHFIRNVFESTMVSDNAKDEFKDRVVYRYMNDGSFRRSLKGFIVFLNGKYYGIVKEMDDLMDLKPSYEGGMKTFHIGYNSSPIYKTTVRAETQNYEHEKNSISDLENYKLDLKQKELDLKQTELDLKRKELYLEKKELDLEKKELDLKQKEIDLQKREFELRKRERAFLNNSNKT